MTFTFDVLLPVMRTVYFYLALLACEFFPVLQSHLFLNWLELILVKLEFLVRLFEAIMLNLVDDLDGSGPYFCLEPVHEIFLIENFLHFFEVLVFIVVLWIFALLFGQVQHIKPL